MTDTPAIKDLTDASGISQSYASMILSGARPPSRSLAVHLFCKLGWRHESIADLTDEQIAVLAEVDPWTPPRERAAA